MDTETNNNIKETLQSTIQAPAVNGSVVEIQKYDVPPGNEKHHLIKLEDFEKYVKTALENESFKDQYEMLKNGQQKPWDVAKKPENKGKNRYGDLLPYDETRVVLRVLKNDQNSDYINASYIDGYNKPRVFICTQGPLERTVIDFWRMIWQEDVRKIIMAANIIENGKKKCEKYWPDVPTRYGDITVSPISEAPFTDYTIRTFKLHKSGVTGKRQVSQYHFTEWPDHGVPSYPLSLVSVLEEAKNCQPNHKAPIVLHCSAGVGRTGTVALLDLALDMARAEGQVDVLGLLCKLRQYRVNLVETVDQFTLVHKALVDALFGDLTRKPAASLVLYFNKLRQIDLHTKRTGLELQFEKLQSLTTPILDDRCITANEPANKDKNRCPNVLPPECGRPHLQTLSSSYINAVNVNGFGQRDAFIVTQYPLPNTIQDFWQLVYESGTQSIVSLNEMEKNDEDAPVFWPESGSLFHGSIKIDHSGTKFANGLIIRKFKLQNVLEKARVVKQYHLQGWKRGEIAPPSAEHVAQLLFHVHRWMLKCKGTKAIIMCYDGATASGLYCAAAFLANQMRQDKMADVLLATRTVRVNRPCFIKTVDQYRWLYEVACALASVIC